MKRNITAVCISGIGETWNVPEIPFYCHTEGYKYYPHFPPRVTRERILYLSSRRNAAHKASLERCPWTEHFLCVDSYYLAFVREIRELVREYSDYREECILGGTNWFLDYSKFPAKIRYWDSWATPETDHRNYDYYPKHEGLPEGWEKVRGCGGFALYPRWVWEKQGYGVPEPFPMAGNETNYLCQCPGISSYLTFNVKVLRQTPKGLVSRSLVNRIRTTVALRTRLGLKRPRVLRD